MRLAKLASLLCVALSALALSTSAIAQTQPAPEPKAPPQTQPAPESKGPPTPVCAGCHEQPHASIAMTAHGANNDASGSMCQACHGDATEHLKDPVKNKPANLIKYGTAAEKNGRLLRLPCAEPAARLLGIGQACAERRRVLELPQHPRQAGQPDDRAVHDDLPSERIGSLRHLPPGHPFADAEAVPSSDRRRQGEVLRLPQSARRDQPRDAAQRDSQRPVRELPRRQARTVRVLPPAGRGELHDLPQPARLVARPSC